MTNKACEIVSLNLKIFFITSLFCFGSFWFWFVSFPDANAHDVDQHASGSNHESKAEQLEEEGEERDNGQNDEQAVYRPNKKHAVFIFICSLIFSRWLFIFCSSLSLEFN